MDFKIENKIVLGLTGSIASGKSTALEVFRELGAEIIDSDELAKKYYKILQDKISDYFKTADRAEISQKVFNDPVKKKWLENSLHPLIIKEAQEIIKNTNKSVIVFDVPLLFETGFDSSFDITLCVYCDYKIRAKRALNRFSAEDFKRRDNAQISLEDKAQRSDIVLYNNGTQKDLQIKINKFYETLVKTRGH